MEIGEQVRVRTFSGAISIRRVVGYSDYGVLVCTEEEFKKAEEEGREPEGIGWPDEDILGPVEEEANA